MIEIPPIDQGDVTPRCTYFGVCGGCRLQHVSMDRQLALKQDRLRDLLAEQGVHAREILSPLEGPEWGYRHRARMSVKDVPKKGGVLVGFRERDGRFITDMERCEIVPPAASSLIRPLRDLIGGLSIRNRIPQLEVAVDDSRTAFVIRHLDPLESDDRTALEAFAREHGVSFYLQPGGTDTVAPLMRDEERALSYGLAEWNVTIAFAPVDFTQVNPCINRALVKRVIELIDPQPGEAVADLFCGVGNFSLPLAATGARVEGYELLEEQIVRARFNAEANGLADRAVFSACDLCRAPDGPRPFDSCGKLLLDPPRSGAEDVVRGLPAEGPRRIVYVSCNPETLARDAGLLVHDKGFELKACGIVNMFPHTLHAEAVALFVR